MNHPLPELRRPGAYDRLRALQKRRRWAGRVVVALLLSDLFALLLLLLAQDLERYL